MSKRMRALSTLALLGALAAAGTGCGHRFTEPVQTPRPPYIPPPLTFILVSNWIQPGWQPTCVFMTHSSVLLVAEDSARVQQYTSLGNSGSAVRATDYQYNGLIKPVQVTEGNAHVFVADMGDATHPIRVVEFDPSRSLTGILEPVSSFTDPAWVRIKGLTSDAQRNLYVSCDATVTVYQPPNPPETDVQSTIYRYPPPYSAAVRDTVAEQGTGIGTVVDAHAVAYNDGKMYVADTGKDWAQQLDPTRKNLGFYKVDGSETDSTLKGPLGVAVDNEGYFYVSDAGNRRVLRYELNGTFNQVVNQSGTDGMLAPASVTVGTIQAKLYLYVADPASNRINVYRFQK
jgi:hypothetical protein